MTNKQLRQYEMLVRVQTFGHAHKERFPDTMVAAGIFATVTDAVQQLAEHATAQLASKREGARARKAARMVLMRQLEAISRTARLIEEDDASFPNTFHMPDRESGSVLVTAARLFARELGPVTPKFLARAMPDTFVADLTSATDVFVQLIRTRETGKGETAAARASIESALASGLAAARKLDVIVTNLVRDDVKALAEWQRVRRVDRTGGRRTGETSSPPDSVSPNVPEEPAA